MTEDSIVIPKRSLRWLKAYRAGFFGVFIGSALGFFLRSMIPIPVAYSSPSVVVEKKIDYARYQKYIINRSRLCYNYSIYSSLASDLSRHVVDKALKYKLPPSLVLGVMEVESTFKTFALSKKDAKGLMQINLQANLAELKNAGVVIEDEIYDPAANIEAGCYLLQKFLKKDGSLETALTSYLGADSKQYKDSVLAAVGRIVLMESSSEYR